MVIYKRKSGKMLKIMNINIKTSSFQSNHSVGPVSGHASQTSSLQQFDKPTSPETLVFSSLP